jgi:hypothetical protein
MLPVGGDLNGDGRRGLESEVRIVIRAKSGGAIVGAGAITDDSYKNRRVEERRCRYTGIIGHLLCCSGGPLEDVQGSVRRMCGHDGIPFEPRTS